MEFPDMRENIIVLGATGSIGLQCLSILRYSFDYRLVGVSLNSHIEKIEPELLYFDSLKFVAIADIEKAKEFKAKHPSLIVFSGDDCNVLLLKELNKATVFNSLLGNCGLVPSLLALRQNQDLLLANKETLVIGSSLVKKEMKTSKSHLYPVDSEHVALAKLLKTAKEKGIRKRDITSLVVTASGGSLRDKKISELDDVKPEEVLRHPTWHMGSKITVDSATLVNKGYEVIEASVLFDFPLSKVGAIICRESLVHALIKYIDKNGKEQTLLEYSPCDMKVAISYALSKGKLETHLNSLDDVKDIEALHFGKIEDDFYPLFQNTINQYKKNGNVGMIFYNAVDTLAIEKFLQGEIPFSYIRTALRYLYEEGPKLPTLSEANLLDIEEESRQYAKQIMIRAKLLLRR